MNKPKQTKTILGKVVSAVKQKTCVVEVTHIIHDPIYKKALKRHKKFATHIEGIEVAVGDQVRIASIAPVSKTKYFKVVEKL